MHAARISQAAAGRMVEFSNSRETFLRPGTEVTSEV